MRMTPLPWIASRRSAAIGLALAAIVLPLVGARPASAVTGTSDPDMRSGHHDAAIPVPGGTVDTMVALPLPAGRWFVTAKAVVEGTASVYGHYGVTCWLITGIDFDQVSAAPLQAGVEGSSVPIWLTVVHRFESKGKAKLRCAAETPSTVVIRLIEITALRAGKLTNGLIDGVDWSTGSGAPRVVSRFRDETIIYPPGGDLRVLAEIRIPAGRWWIQAKAILAGGPGPSATLADCAMLGFSTGPVVDNDSSTIGLSPIGSGGDQSSLGLQIVGSFDGGSNSKVSMACIGGNGFQVSWLKITAVDLGKLTSKAFSSGSNVTVGSGTPRVIFGFTALGPPINLPASSSYSTVTSMSVPAGRWSVSANLWLEGSGASSASLVQCKLVLGSDEGRSAVVLHGTNAGRVQAMYLQVNQRVEDSTEVRLRCKRTNAAVVVALREIRFVALKAGSLPDTGL
jgi:hypothetical protein